MALHTANAFAEGIDSSSSEAQGTDNSGPSIFSISGFGTLGVVHSSEDQADFTSSLYKPDGAGHTHTWSADVDSLLGIQLSANFSPKLSAVLQIISEQNYDDTYRPHVEWANIKYHFTPDFSVSVGRVVMPSFLASDYRKVGYANPWVRPPVEVYRLLPVTKNDGLAASYRMQLGEAISTFQAVYGGLDQKEVNGSTDEARNQWGIFNTTVYDNLTFHAAYLEAELNSTGTRPLFDAFRGFGAEGNAIANKFDCDGDVDAVTSLGASYDPGDWFLMAEWARIRPHCFIGNQTGWYISSGYRIGKFTPYITYAESNANSSTSHPGLNVAALPSSVAGPAIGLNAGLNTILNTPPQQKTISIGSRWDFMENTALKLQFDHTQIEEGSSGGLINSQPGFQQGDKVNLFSATIDFVF